MLEVAAFDTEAFVAQLPQTKQIRLIEQLISLQIVNQH